ncbi:hypothetical protein PG996_007747 [Apiospora saccharicola]|uniref:Uncharacterized protein n=1 Tax=Apiospora saccharicola TaxID=335842 RepID=A0ABR1VBP5_9PEZI
MLLTSNGSLQRAAKALHLVVKGNGATNNTPTNNARESNPTKADKAQTAVAPVEQTKANGWVPPQLFPPDGLYGLASAQALRRALQQVNDEPDANYPGVRLKSPFPLSSNSSIFWIALVLSHESPGIPHIPAALL